jgi:hypothetical protein
MMGQHLVPINFFTGVDLALVSQTFSHCQYREKPVVDASNFQNQQSSNDK